MHILYTVLYALLMCWQGEFVQQSRGSSVDHHLLYSHDLNVDSGMILKREIRC